MEYKPDFETRRDIFKLNVFHNKKTGEKVTMYFVPRTTPVNEDTIFDYCTRNQTWREKEAQKWCNEKNGKNKDKLKSLPYVASGLQRDLKWFGDKAQIIFNDYKKGLGLGIQSKSNVQDNEKQGFQEKLKALADLGEKEIVQKFNEIFHTGGENWQTFSAGYNATGEELMNAVLRIKGKDGQVKTFRTEDPRIKTSQKEHSSNNIKPAVGKRAAQRNVILAFLAEEYGIKKTEEKSAEKPLSRAEIQRNHAMEQGFGDELKYLRVLDERADIKFSENIFANYYMDTPYGKTAFLEEDDMTYHVLNVLNVSREAIRTVKVSDKEKAEINKQIDEEKKHFIAYLEQQRIAQKQAEQQKNIQEEKKLAEQRVRQSLEAKKIENIKNINLSVVEKNLTDNNHRRYVLQDNNGHQYKLSVDYGDTKEREHHPDGYEAGYGYMSEKIEIQTKPMRTLTVAYEKIGGKEDDKFAFSAAVEPEVFAKNPLSIDLVFGSNLNLTINQKNGAEKHKALFLKTCLTKSNDSINASPRIFKLQQKLQNQQ